MVVENVAAQEDVGFALVCQHLDRPRRLASDRHLDEVRGDEKHLPPEAGEVAGAREESELGRECRAHQRSRPRRRASRSVVKCIST